MKTTLRWTIRVLVWLSGGFIVFVFARNGSERMLSTGYVECAKTVLAESARPVNPSERMQLAEQTFQCIEKKSGFFPSLFLSKRRAMAFLAPVTPCKYVGVWRSIRSSGEYTVELAPDGRFFGGPAAGFAGSDVEGVWSVVDGNMQWVYPFPFQPWRPDSNPIVDEKANEFVLIEETGERTLFRLIKRASTACEDNAVGFEYKTRSFLGVKPVTATGPSTPCTRKSSRD